MNFGNLDENKKNDLTIPYPKNDGALSGTDFSKITNTNQAPQEVQEAQDVSKEAQDVVKEAQGIDQEAQGVAQEAQGIDQENQINTEAESESDSDESDTESDPNVINSWNKEGPLNRSSLLQDLRIKSTDSPNYTNYLKEPYTPITTVATAPIENTISSSILPISSDLNNIAEAVENIQNTMSKLGNQLGLLLLTLKSVSSSLSTKGGTRHIPKHKRNLTRRK